jgi:hypothetical protein
VALGTGASSSTPLLRSRARVIVIAAPAGGRSRRGSVQNAHARSMAVHTEGHRRAAHDCLSRRLPCPWDTWRSRHSRGLVPPPAARRLASIRAAKKYQGG